MTDQVRTRYAPSPTGFPHIGNIRTALFEWLFARHYDGKFLIRIEDTDVARSVAGSVDAILQGLHWLGIDWDEGPDIGGPYAPYYQSQRLPLYQAAAKKLDFERAAILRDRVRQLKELPELNEVAKTDGNAPTERRNKKPTFNRTKKR